MNTATESTQEIDYKSCDTIEFRAPTGPRTASRRRTGPGAPARARRAWERARRAVLGTARRAARHWPRIWPPLVGTLLGFSTAAALWCLFLMWWFDA